MPEPKPKEAPEALNEAPRPALIGKLSKIMGELKDIPKTGFNQSQKYAFRKADDVDAAVSKELAKHNVILWPNLVEESFTPLYTTQSNMTMWIAKVIVEYQFIDGDTGEVTPLSRIPGTGADTGDKGHAKAMTMSKKYFLSQVFLIGGNDDPEADEKVDKAAAAAGAVKGPVVVGKSAVAGAGRGGKSAHATAAQVTEIARLAGKLQLDADSIVPVIKKVIGTEPEEGQKLREWLGSLTSEQAAGIVAALAAMDTFDAEIGDVPEEAAQGGINPEEDEPDDVPVV
jgi:hypothetical protein